MRYVSLDLETTGIDWEQHQVIEIGAVVDDTSWDRPLDDLPVYHAYVYHRTLRGTPFALNMNQRILDVFIEYENALQGKENSFELPPGSKMLTKESVAQSFQSWLFREYVEASARKDSMEGALRVVFAGKNFATFDLRFLEKLPRWEKCVNPARRVLDVGSMYFEAEDKEVPNIKTCIERAYLQGMFREHFAVDDALSVVELVRRRLGKGPREVR